MDVPTSYQGQDAWNETARMVSSNFNCTSRPEPLVIETETEKELYAILLCLSIIGTTLLLSISAKESKSVVAMSVISASMVHVLLSNSSFAFALFLGSLAPLFFMKETSKEKFQVEIGLLDETSLDHKKAHKKILKEHQHKQGSFLLETGSIVSSKAVALADIIAAKKQQYDQGARDISTNTLGRELLEKRSKNLGPNVSCFYADEGGLVITKGEGSYLIDPDGNRYLDCCNNVAAVGHSHPRVVKAGTEALSNIQTNSRFLHPTHQRYIDKLLKTFESSLTPATKSSLDTVYLVNSGSEANDLALRIARAHAEVKGLAAKPQDVICLDSAYHGHTQSLVEISPYKWYQSMDGKDYKGQNTHVATLPDSFRGKFRGFTKDTGLAYAKEVEEIVKNNNGVGVFIAESVVGCGGQVELPPAYLSACYDAVRKYGGVTIADEVQTGFARSGTHFWHFQTFDVVPDIVTFGKPCGNGYPIAGVVCRREIADSFAKSGIEYFNTFGGNSVACSIAESVIDVIEDERLMEHAKQVGDYMLEHLRELQKEFVSIGDVRGQGLFLGVEFVVSRENDLTPDADLCKFVVDFLRFDRVIISRDGPDHNVIKIKPPLVFGKEEADKLIGSIRSALEVAKKEA